MTELVPSQLASETPTFLRIAKRSKAPKRGNSASDGPFYHCDDSEIVRHLGGGGNLARVLRDDLVAFDIDSDQLKKIVEDRLPDSFEIESGGEGTGFHRYYRSPEFEGNQIEFRDSGTELGGLRSGNSYCLVPPSKHDETGNDYSVSEDKEIAYLPADVIENLISDLKGKSSQHPGGGGGQRGVGERKGAEAPIPSEYPSKEASWNTLRKWLSENGLLDRLNQTTSEDWSGDEYVLAKCLAEGGFSKRSISTALDHLHHDSKWHNHGENYQKLTIQKAIEAACSDEFVSFGTGDMGVSEASESHKTEESGEGRTLQGGEQNMPEFNDKLAVSVLEGDEEGDSFKKAVLVEGNDNGDTFEYVSLKKGRVEEAQTTDGDTVVVENVSDSVSLGSPEYLDDLISGLQELNEQINE